MEWQQLIMDVNGQVLRVLEKALDGLTQDDLNRQPHPDCNSMGWLTWHLTRMGDGRFATLIGEEQLWVSDKWYARFNRPSDPSDRGIGHSSEDVAAFRSPDVDTLLEYYRAVLERTRRYISSLSMTDLDQEINMPPPQTPQKVGVFLMRDLNGSLQHAGQVAYLRGLFKGKGWLGV